MAGNKAHVKLYRTVWLGVLICVAFAGYHAWRQQRPLRAYPFVADLRMGWDEAWYQATVVVRTVANGGQGRTIVLVTAALVLAVIGGWAYVQKGKKPSILAGGSPASGLPGVGKKGRR